MRNTPSLTDSSHTLGPARWWGVRRCVEWRQLVPTRQALAFAIVYIVWGSTYLGIHVGVESIPPFILAGARSFVAGLVLLGWALLRGAPRATGRQWLSAGVAGVLMLAGGNGLVTWAETRVSSSLAALLIAAVPAHVALLDGLRPGGTRPSRRVWLGIATGMLGMALLVRPTPGTVAQSHWQGVIAVGIAGLCWALGSLYARYAPMHPDRALSSAHQMIVGGATLLVIAWVKGEPHSFDVAAVTGRSLVALTYLTLFGSLLAFSAFNWLAGATTPSRLSTTAYVNPVVALVLGWLVLDETLHPLSLVGALTIVGAVAIMVSTPAAPAKLTPPLTDPPEPLPPGSASPR